MEHGKEDDDAHESLVAPVLVCAAALAVILFSVVMYFTLF